MRRIECCRLGRSRIYFPLAIYVSVLLAGVPVRSEDRGPGAKAELDAEPARPKAEKAIRFSESWDAARMEAQRSGRRILAYFTGDYCGWCRVMEKETFRDAEVAGLSRQYICVKLNVGKGENLRLADEYRIDTIPRTLIFTAEGQVIDRRTGYVPAPDYATWLTKALTKPVVPIGTEHRKIEVPLPVGAPESEADLVVWFVDARDSMPRWSDTDWTGHTRLLELFRAVGLQPRIEHMAREDFPARWDRAEATGRVPNLISAEFLAGLVRDLSHKNRLVPVVSSRLHDSPENASCSDFARRWIHLVRGSRNEEYSRKAVATLLQPGPETALPGVELAESAGRTEAADVARRAASAYMAGDPATLRQVASGESPQLSRCTKADSSHHNLEVTAGAVEVRGGEHTAFARVEVSYGGQQMLGQDPFLVVLRRESSRWRAFAVANDIETLKALPQLCSSTFTPSTGSEGPATARLTWPADGSVLPDSKKPLTWEVPHAGESVVFQVCELLSDNLGAETRGESWPYTTLQVRPGEPRSGSFPTGSVVTGMPIRWCVWSIGASGRMVTSEVRGYDFASQKK